MQDFNLDDCRTRKHFALSFRALIGDVEDFLEFSETSIESQRQAVLEAIHKIGDPDTFPDGYLEHLLANAEHRFAVSLPIRLRYAALVSLVTTVEWEGRMLRDYALFKIGDRPPGMNEAVHILRRYDAELSLGARTTIGDYERLVHIRNVVAHNAGFVPGYQFESQVREALALLNGFGLEDRIFVGECVKIERGALDPYIRAMSCLMPTIWETADSQGRLKL
jgi:hypothetical protein